MGRETMIQIGVLYGPLVMAGLWSLWLRPKGMLAVGLLFSTVWQAVMLPWFDLGARALQLWSYQATDPSLAGMPLALYFGWIIAWGWLVPLMTIASGTRWPLTLIGVIALDLWLMPQLEPLVVLSSGWWLGDFVLFVGLMVPGILLCHFTHQQTHLPVRVVLLAGCFGGLLLGIPLLASIPPDEIFPRLRRGIDQPQWLGIATVLALPGIAAMRDLARSGGGTPVPLDPTQRLVSHGIYGFIANPMQVSMTLLLLLAACFLKSASPIIVAALGVIYSEGFARWSETQEMHTRFGTTGTRYQSLVRPWWPRWRPVALEDCELWVDFDCGPCRSIGSWFRDRHASGLVIRPAGEWQGDELKRVTWRHPASGRCESGTAAIGMALQHLSLPWALSGILLGCPGLCQVIQCCMDAAGLGPKASGTKAVH